MATRRGNLSPLLPTSHAPHGSSHAATPFSDINRPSMVNKHGEWSLGQARWCYLGVAVALATLVWLGSTIYWGRSLGISSESVRFIDAMMSDAVLNVRGSGSAAGKETAFVRHVKALTAEEMAGRAPGTAGERLAVEYIKRVLREEAMLPSVVEQQVPLVGLALDEERGQATVKVSFAGARSSSAKEAGPPDVSFVLAEDVMITADAPRVVRSCHAVADNGDNYNNAAGAHQNGALLRKEGGQKRDGQRSTGVECPQSWPIDVDAPLVFGGFCINSPADSWDDFKGSELTGAIVLCLVNEPDGAFDGPDVLTLHGRWTTKLAAVRKRGARGVLFVHTDQMAGYPWSVVSGAGRRKESKQLRQDAERDNSRSALEVRGWLSEQAAAAILRSSSACIDASSPVNALCTVPGLKRVAELHHFKPTVLGARLTVSATMRLRYFSGINVVGVLPAQPDTESDYGHVLVTAHHDHLGSLRAEDTPDDGLGSAFPGALDNAAGVAAMLSLATAASRAAMAHSDTGRVRSVVFASLTAEESGLLGATYFAENPPLGPRLAVDNAAADINFDVMNVFVQTQDVVGLGSELSDIGVWFGAAAQSEGLRVSTADKQSRATGSFLRSDAAVFAERGIPTVYLWHGIESAELGRSVLENRAEFVRERYHKRGDVYDESWNIGAAMQQIRVAARLAGALVHSAKELKVYRLP